MGKYKGKNPDLIYKAAINSIIHSLGHKNIDEKRMRGCLSKAGYDTEFEGQVMAAKRGMNVYKCLYCPHYHLTKQGTEKEQNE